MKIRQNALLIAVIAAVLAMTATTPAAAQDPVPPPESLEGAFKAQKHFSPYAGRNFPTQVFWGDTHLHTGMSMDAGAFGARLTPVDAYRFARGEELTSIVDHLRSVKGTQVALLFREHKGKIKVNLRSKEKVNVQKIAAELGGGGHIRAAGVSLAGPIDEARDKVLAAVRKHLC